ncbi:MAG: sugar ABC transporter ATP-binding protein [Opitutae bacterium]|nr:sugar ABC transporter ATP-binding protein [Opitutae bacterium]
MPERPPDDTTTEPVLSCAAVEKSYGGIRALRGVSWDLRRGEVHALCGENGAGKSTLARICCGLTTPDAGELRLDGRPVRWRNAADAHRAGIAMIMQELDLFPGLTVAENIALDNPRLEGRGVVNFDRLHRAVQPHLREVGLALDPATPLGEIALAQAQLVAIARALSFEARVIFMDEPTSALTDDAVERLFAVIAKLRRQGVAIVYVSHKMAEIFRVSDRVSVMRDGEHVATLRAAETNVDSVIRHMVGRAVSLTRRPSPQRSTANSLVLRRVGTRKLRDVSFAVASGEVLGVAGLVGAGRSELGRALAGISRVETGEIVLRGESYAPRSVREAIGRGVAWLPEDRREGLALQMEIRANLTLAQLRRFATRGWISGAREQSAAANMIARCGVKCASAAQPVGALSGGNQQKVLIGKSLLAEPTVCFFDDPTRGIDIGAKDELAALVADLAARGMTIIWVSSELPELLANAHRILVMREGRVAGIVDAATATQESIMKLATGS